MCTIDKLNDSRKNETMLLTVHFVSTFEVSLPNADSAAPPPRDEPIPEFADGLCIKMTKTTKTLVKTRNKYIKNVKT
jgi:hypothetical protein